MPKTRSDAWRPGPGAARTAQSFSVLAGSTVTNTGATTVPEVSGSIPGSRSPASLRATSRRTIHAGDGVAHQAASDVVVAYDAVAGEARTLDLTGQIFGGQNAHVRRLSLRVVGRADGRAHARRAARSERGVRVPGSAAAHHRSNSSVRVINGGATATCSGRWAARRPSGRQ